MLLKHIKYKYFLKYNDKMTNIQIVIGGLYFELNTNGYLYVVLGIARELVQSTWLKVCVLVVDMLPLCSTFKATVSVLYMFQSN